MDAPTHRRASAQVEDQRFGDAPTSTHSAYSTPSHTDEPTTFGGPTFQSGPNLSLDLDPTLNHAQPPNQHQHQLSGHDHHRESIPGQPPPPLQRTKDFGFLPIPPRLRYDPAKPFHFGLALNIAFGFASTFTVANLYYCQPLLIQFSESFGVTYDDVSRIPTLVQAGYATGLLLISPLGDLVPRRPLLLLLLTTSTSLTIGLALAHTLHAFSALSFLVGVVTVTPQVLLPLAADLAPPHKRASSISVVLSGLLFGILIARVLAGIIAQYTTWRVVYYFAIAVQALVLVGAYYLLPDYPSKNTHLTYAKILGSMVKYAVTEPVLIQAYLVNMASSACFASFWVTLTFLLGGEPYGYDTLIIGLFGLVGIAGVAFGPFVGLVIDRLVPWYASLLAILSSIVFQAIQTGAGGGMRANKAPERGSGEPVEGYLKGSVAVVIVVAFGLDVCRQMLQVSLTTAALGISAAARARLNAVLILGIFLGQVLGTSAGTHLFVTYGWRPAAALSLGLMGWQLFVLLIRGPHCQRYTWFGYEGGRAWRRVVEKPEGAGAGGVEEGKGSGNGSGNGSEKMGEMDKVDEKSTNVGVAVTEARVPPPPPSMGAVESAPDSIGKEELEAVGKDVPPVRDSGAQGLREGSGERPRRRWFVPFGRGS